VRKILVASGSHSYIILCDVGAMEDDHGECSSEK
jgi:hypothetical protein